MELTYFSIDGNIWIFIGISLLLILYTIYSYYYTIPEISKNNKTILILLRAFSLLLILFLIFNPKLIYSSYKEIEPKIAFLVDNSQSMKIKDRSYNRSELFTKIMNNFDFYKFDNKIDFYSFDGDIKQIQNFSLASIPQNGRTTNIYKAINHISKLIDENNYQAMVLLTDGAFNSGANPVYLVDNFPKPIFTIGIGDTIPPKDIIIKSIISSEVTFVNNKVDVSAQISITGYPNREFPIMLYEDDKLIETQQIKTIERTTNYNFTFSYQPRTEGIHKISISIPRTDDEYSFENNTNSTFIKVIKNKKIISIFSSAPNPDVSFIYQHLILDKEIKVNQFIQKFQSNFYITPTDKDIQETQLFILIDFPAPSTPDNVINKIANELQEGKPLLFIWGNNLDRRKLQLLHNYLPIDISSFSNREFMAGLSINEAVNDNPLMRIEGMIDYSKQWQSLPPIYKTETFTTPKMNSKVLAYSTVDNVKMQEPMIAISDFGSHRSVVVLGYGLFRWKLLGTAKEISRGNLEQIDLFSVFIDNTIRWLSISNVEQQVVVKTLKKQFSSTEPIEFIGNVLDNSLNPIDNATVQIELKGKDYSKIIDMVATGNGNYYAKISSLPKGDYAFDAKAILNNTPLGNSEGRFSVGVINFELLDLTMNKTILQQLANYTNGAFYENNADGLENRILKLKNFTKTNKLIQTEFEFINRWWGLILLVIAFSLEWFIRKKLSLI